MYANIWTLHIYKDKESPRFEIIIEFERLQGMSVTKNENIGRNSINAKDGV
jgi:hypothetical protein